MATTRSTVGQIQVRPIDIPPTLGRRVLTAGIAFAVLAFVVTAESLAPLPLVLIACSLVVAGFGFGIYAWLKGTTVDQPHATAWDYAGTLLFAGFALATAIGSSWMAG